MKHWEDLVLETAERFGGTFPHPDTSASIAAVHERAPNAVERAIDEVAADYASGTISSPWGILRSRVGKITADVHAKATVHTVREKAIARAEQWMRTAGLHYDREAEIEDELYGERGQLRHHPETRQRMLELWNELRPIGVQLDEEADERGRRYQEQRHLVRNIPSGTTRSLEDIRQIAARKGADTTPLM